MAVCVGLQQHGTQKVTCPSSPEPSGSYREDICIDLGATGLAARINAAYTGAQTDLFVTHWEFNLCGLQSALAVTL